MTIQFVDVPPKVQEWYARKADEMGMATPDLMAHTLTLHAMQTERPRQDGPGVFYTHEPLGAAIESGAFLVHLGPRGEFAPNTYTLPDALGVVEGVYTDI